MFGIDDSEERSDGSGSDAGLGLERGVVEDGHTRGFAARPCRRRNRDQRMNFDLGGGERGGGGGGGGERGGE